MTALAALTDRLTLPYRRGAEFMPIRLGADAAGLTAIVAYDFADYRARWGQDPAAPVYVVAPRADLGGDDVVLTLTFTGPAPGTLTVTIPRFTEAGTGVALTLPPGSDAGLRLTTLAASPAPPGSGANAWSVQALLGTTAQLIWLLAAEKDALNRARRVVRESRLVETARGAALDAIGRDLSVPRFPPRPYSFDDRTLALWHLDDRVPNGGAVLDATTRPGAAGHPGIVAGAVAGAVGKYGTGFAMNGGAITIAASPAFGVAATADLTVEAFVNATAPADDIPRAIVVRRAAETALPTAVPGWSLCVVRARGFAANVLFAICDGTTELRCFADLSIADGTFHHVAGMIDRGRGRARLFVDGVQRASVPLATLGAVTPPDAIRLGATAAGNALAGVVDEVRLSSVPRATFHPALGEDDEAYRARLRLFRRWVAPTPQRLIDMVNEAAPLNGDPAPYVLVEANRTTQVAEAGLRIVPATIAAGIGIGCDGAAAPDETVAGTPADDAKFDPALDLVTYANPAVSTVATPGGARMQAGAARALDRLAARLTAAAIVGQIVLDHAYEPNGPTPLHRVGRALRFRHSTLTTADLAARAHRAGFAYVANLGLSVAAAIEPGERLAITAAGPRADVGTAFDLVVSPTLPTAGVFNWTIVTPGPAQAHFAPHSADPATLKTPLAGRPRVRLVLDQPGALEIRVEHSFRGFRRAGSLSLRIDPVTLADGRAIDASGNPDPDVIAVAGTPDPGFAPAYLVTHPPVPGILFGADPNAPRMQVAARDALDALVALLAARGVAGRVTVARGFVPADTGLPGTGRQLVIGHETLDPGALGALAARIFDHVARAGAAITATVRRDAWVAIVDATTGARVDGDVPLGTKLSLAVAPAPLPPGVFNWSTRAIGNGAGSFDTVQRPTATFTPTKPGPLVLAVTTVATDPARAAPYTFELRLKPSLDVPATLIPKPQYDIIMNVLDAFHPIGVEVRTDRIRSHVPEIEQDPTKAFPAYSFPNFRL